MEFSSRTHCSEPAASTRSAHRVRSNLRTRHKKGGNYLVQRFDNKAERNSHCIYEYASPKRQKSTGTK